MIKINLVIIELIYKIFHDWKKIVIKPKGNFVFVQIFKCIEKKY